MVLWYEYGVLSFALFCYLFNSEQCISKKEPIFVSNMVDYGFYSWCERSDALACNNYYIQRFRFFKSQMCNLNLYSSKNAD